MGNSDVNLVLKAARKECYEARDRFYQCVEEQGIVFEADKPNQGSKCKAQRTAFERSCKPSWVKHFDVAHDKQLRLLQTLRKSIRESEGAATGSLAGKPQS